MKFFRSPSYNSEPEFVEIDNKKKEKLAALSNQDQDWMSKLKHNSRRICSRAFFVPFRNVAILYALCHFNGVGSLIVYMVTIFEESGMELDATLAPVIVLSLRIVTALLSFVLMSKFEVNFQLNGIN